MKARYLFLFLLTISQQTKTQSGLDHLVALGHGIIGYDTMYLSKKLGKETANPVFPKDTFSVSGTPNGTANAIAAVDSKLAYNDAAKRLLKELLPEISNQNSLSSTLFATGNKVLSLGEFYEKMKETLDELQHVAFNEMPAKSDPESSSLTATLITFMHDVGYHLYTTGNQIRHDPQHVNSVISELREDVRAAVVMPIKQVFDYFYKTASAVVKDQHAAFITASYLFTAWILCTLTRNAGNELTKALGAHIALFKKGSAPFDQIMKTTLGMFMSAFAENPIRSHLLMENSTMTETKKLRDLAWRAGIKGPFGLDGFNALHAGLSVYMPALMRLLKVDSRHFKLTAASLVLILLLYSAS